MENDQPKTVHENYLRIRYELYAFPGIIPNLSEKVQNKLFEEFRFFDSLKNSVERISEEDIIKKDPASYESTPKIEFTLYVRTAKQLAYFTLCLLLQGSLLAVDTDLIHPKIYPTKEDLKKAAQSFVAEVKQTYDPFLKFNEIEKGVKHLEELVAKL